MLPAPLNLGAFCEALAQVTVEGQVIVPGLEILDVTTKNIFPFDGPLVQLDAAQVRLSFIVIL